MEGVEPLNIRVWDTEISGRVRQCRREKNTGGILRTKSTVHLSVMHCCIARGFGAIASLATMVPSNVGFTPSKKIRGNYAGPLYFSSTEYIICLTL
jgi:hypothetical protein